MKNTFVSSHVFSKSDISELSTDSNFDATTKDSDVNVTKVKKLLDSQKSRMKKTLTCLEDLKNIVSNPEIGNYVQMTIKEILLLIKMDEIKNTLLLDALDSLNTIKKN
jgi:glutaredoxin 2